MSSVVQLVNYLNYVVCSIVASSLLLFLSADATPQTCLMPPLPHSPVMRPSILQSSLLLLLLLFLSAVGAAFNSKFAAAVTVFWRWLDKAS